MVLKVFNSSVGIISPICKDVKPDNTFESSLHQRGYVRGPSSYVWMTPHKEMNGEYRTGLDPDAWYIKQMKNPEAKAAEIKIVTELRDYVKENSTFDISSRSDFYAKIFQKGSGEVTADKVKFKDGKNIFNFSNIKDVISFAWLRVHPDVAASKAAWLEKRPGSTGSNVRWYIENSENESKETYNKNKEIDKATTNWGNMSEERRLKVATLLGLKVTFNTSPEVVYNLGREYIKDTSSRFDNVRLFNSIYELSDEDIDVKFIVKEALAFNIYRFKPGGRVFEGEVEIGKTESDVIDMLSSVTGQDDLLALKEKIRQRKIE